LSLRGLTRLSLRGLTRLSLRGLTRLSLRGLTRLSLRGLTRFHNPPTPYIPPIPDINASKFKIDFFLY